MATRAALLTGAALLLTAAMLSSAIVPTEAATLRTMTTLHGPHVKLSDLFDDAGAKADLVLGPGPAPGGRIVVGSAQLTAIARQFAVDWRRASSADRAVLDWPGRPLPREAALGALREAIAASGVTPDNCEIDLAGFTSPLIPLDGTPHPLVSQLAYDRTTGRFTAMLSVTADGIIRSRADCRPYRRDDRTSGRHGETAGRDGAAGGGSAPRPACARRWQTAR